ncbi:alpha/beta hydrolase [Modestobacter marinus]|uniref:Pimeloyl-ACP methyl ester carboxylesterase n=1 Tax=Modestobacter marinus TaxID=477641 RepID=A0A846M1Q6_9ACTN|nr:alpha/beta hydrolase [Modestobacter marinus]NIH68460.1 pimeloyl-ACP methyl ester carboxylesterase [Modestobacter marinus]GGL57378.1 proteinase [Modestobacter marinus]
MTARHRLTATGGAVLALALTLAGCTSSGEGEGEGETAAAGSTTEAPAEPEAQLIDWTDCDSEIDPIIAGRPGSERDLTFSCGTTTVPVSYDDPEGGTLQLFLVRASLNGQTYPIGSLFVNPGGPGQSAADAAIQAALTLPEAIVNQFDIVGLDPRGSGLSTPVECISDEQKDELFAADPRVIDAAAQDALFSEIEEVAAGCSDEYQEALGAFNTVDAARDMDLVRQSLGDDQLNYLGYSYGTTLGSTYAELFPEQVRAMVLDGAVDPNATEQEAAEAQAQGFEAAYDAFAANCLSLISGCPLGPDPRAFLGELLTQAAAAPIPSSREGETRQATPGLILGGVRSALYQPSAWPQLAQSLAAARNGDAAGILTLADTYTGRNDDGTYSNVVDANLAVNCADTDEEFSASDVQALAADWNARYPLFGADAALSLYTCSAWEAPRTPLPERDAAGSPPILVIGTQGDPVTPVSGAVDLAEELENGVLLTWQGSGHTAYPKTECVTAAVNAYLIDLAVPQDGLTCPA